MYYPAGWKDLTRRVRASYNKSGLLHETFDAAILIKGIDGILEVIGGFLLLLVTPAGLMKVVALLTQHELAEDPNDLIAHAILNASRNFSISSRYFGAFYLVSHGVIKLFLIAMLWRRKLWSYPLAIVFLFLFIVYQVVRYTRTHSLWLIGLSVFDLAVILLTWLEYERLKYNKL
jgi:uncharacterized membrane protein